MPSFQTKALMVPSVAGNKKTVNFGIKSIPLTGVKARNSSPDELNSVTELKIMKIWRLHISV